MDMTDALSSPSVAPAGDAPSPFAAIDADMVREAVRRGRGGASSDFDLLPGGRASFPPAGAPLRQAGVLCPLVDRGDGLRVILTRRADHLRQHAGQVAFPGGRVDPTDPSLLHAALREADEEIGLAAHQVDIFGAIDGHETGTGYAITPFVGLVTPDFAPRSDPSEVAEVFEPPLAFLMDPANRRTESRYFQGRDRRYYAMPWEGRYIWGATARMLVGLSDRLADLLDEAGLGGGLRDLRDGARPPHGPG
ncbi:8-oxo-dGTP pyrophosphatase MutT, NUDIX family [Albimonas donghaensis]|uniref:8-oxo-dGTP pyrophosphatase MutT, NUDIX family n=2 Tax=Albimonas donghaensis TaxID=356660 RepID=A0A1H2VV90_9RHOB|nr:8-oxo-dGTP pyrophosphatase MutT, NUDIX family [Albimonas donghaensis]